ncbi:MAG: UDP-N-acetylmuramoyl-L-alanine--D-glutamate ligase [Erysipelothrix sp.]|nr:UDP-N-acetylmuramoyl-L-alanine--D-glutamate ligase [Erysipelothrix sp.]
MKALVIGGALSGTAAAYLLNKNGFDVTVVSNSDFDSRLDLEAKGIHVVLSDADTSDYDDAVVVVKNPGIPNSHPLVKRFENIINEIELAVRANPLGRYYAISGTNGKTTSTHMLHEMLLKKDKYALLAGNVGIPLSQKIYEDGNLERDIALEISAFQMEGTPQFEPKIYALLNLTPDHLDRYDSEKEYYQAKLDIIPRSKIFIRNIDDENISKLTKNIEHKSIINISLNTKADAYIEDDIAYYKGLALFDTRKLKVVGKHNVYNALFAAVMAYLAHVKVSDIQDVLYSFTGIAHRLEFVKEVKGVRYYNDSKATNPESTEVALKAFDKNIILLAGGFDKHISFDLLKPYLEKIKSVYLFGESKDQLKEIFQDGILVDDLDTALALAEKEAIKGDVVLLSPACASYDQFKNFEERGDHFKSLVSKIK